jgi:hypothetical protein
MDTGDLVIRPWRIGRRVGRTIYVMTGDEPSDDDILIGMMDHANIAAVAVLAHNNTLKDQGVIGG